MVLPVSQAQSYTNTAIINTSTEDVTREVQITEGGIRTAAGQEKFKVIHNARIIGNPLGDPNVDVNLSEQQIAYRDVYNNAGYIVGLDEDTGYWVIDWSFVGPEELVSVYSVRTIELPGAGLSQDTLDQIDLFFSDVLPAVTSTSLIIPINGGDIDETDFGGTISVFYEYMVIVTQPNDDDHSTDLRDSLTTNLTAYVDSPSNIFVYKLD